METPKFDVVEKTRFHDVTWIAEIPSTNTELLERARRGALEGEVVIADLQTAGRGRRGRTWTAPAGTSLMMSILLRPPATALSPSDASLATSALALATRNAVAGLTDVNLEIKWPNDLVVAAPFDHRLEVDIGYRKVAGILTETLIQNASIDALVIGMGINTSWGVVPAELQSIATSLDVLSGSSIDRNALALDILKNLEIEYTSLLRPNGKQQLLQEVKKHSGTLGKQVRVQLGTEPKIRQIVGRAVDLDESGQLVLETENNEVQVVAAGDVEHLRLDT
ncbi:MAG: biotin--[acetyl-CoA-carboxylase] ligase [Actinomycetota bacterium]|nr:biotin--[acetyl-CoA-carboxylase] ligase [Actinomycetota bacterium]